MSDAVLSVESALLNQYIDLAKVSGFPMDGRDFRNNAFAKTEYLGKDTAHENKQKEFNTLPEQKQEEIKKSKNLSEYGEYHHGSKDEAIQALAVLKVLTAREIVTANISFKKHPYGWAHDVDKHLELSQTSSAMLKKETFVNNILTTFPDGKITQEKVQQALTPFLK